MSTRIALAGNPNCGKTTLFNALTGSNQYVGNWPGVTVEKKAGKLKGNKDVEIIDLPGIYSLSPYTLEEVVTRQFLLEETPDVVINIIDATNIERNLYLTTQILELGIPVVLALNMMDLVRKKEDTIYKEKLAEELGCSVVEISALKNEGLDDVLSEAMKYAKHKPTVAKEYIAQSTIREAISTIESMIAHKGSKVLRFDAVKLFERDTKVQQALALSVEEQEAIETVIVQCEMQEDDDSESIITNERYHYIEEVVKKTVEKQSLNRASLSDKIDQIVTHRVLALPIFMAIMFFVYYIAVTTVGTWVTDYTNDTLFGTLIPSTVEGFLVSIGTAEWLNSLILDGIIGGVGAVLGFVPQLMILFLLLGILEDCGYMSRVAFIMDRVFRHFGLSGKSFIPMLVGTGCSVPGIMASRTIESEADRKMTIMTTSFIPCGAKLPIIALIAGALFSDAWWVAPSTYFVGVMAVLLSGIILKKTKRFSGDVAPFVMELPTYHMPTVRNVLLQVWDRSWSFIKKAGTVIFISSGMIWFLSNFNFSLEMVDTTESILASLGKVIAPIFAPLGFGTWQSTVATLTGLIAKENVVGTMGVLYGFTEVAENGAEIWSVMASEFTTVSAYAFLMFNLLCAPCFAAVGAIKREMANIKWTLFAIGYQTVLAYVVALMVNQFGLVLTGSSVTVWTGIAVVALAILVYLIFRKPAGAAKKGVLGAEGLEH